MKLSSENGFQRQRAIREAGDCKSTWQALRKISINIILPQNGEFWSSNYLLFMDFLSLKYINCDLSFVS